MTSNAERGERGFGLLGLVGLGCGSAQSHHHVAGTRIARVLVCSLTNKQTNTHRSGESLAFSLSKGERKDCPPGF